MNSLLPTQKRWEDGWWQWKINIQMPGCGILFVALVATSIRTRHLGRLRDSRPAMTVQSHTHTHTHTRAPKSRRKGVAWSRGEGLRTGLCAWFRCAKNSPPKSQQDAAG